MKLKQIHTKLRLMVLILALSIVSIQAKSQSVSFALTTSPNIHFDFDAVADFINGITYMNAFILNIDADLTEWDLYVGATTTVPGTMNVTASYSPNGTVPPVSIVQLRFRNAANTSLQSGFFNLTDIGAPVYIIGSAVNDAAVACGAQGTNEAGDYLGSPDCHKFNVDLRIVPGLNYRPGMYNLRIDYVLVQDL